MGFGCNYKGYCDYQMPRDSRAELKNFRENCYTIPKGKEDRKEEIILHNLLCRDANVSDCEEVDRIARVLVRAGYVRRDKENL